MNLGVISYSLAVSSSLVLALLLLTTWRGRLFGTLLLLAVVMTSLWAISAAWLAGFGTAPAGVAYRLFEALRYMAWYGLLLSLLTPFEGAKKGLRRVAPLVLAFPPLVLLFYLASDWFIEHIPHPAGADIRIVGHVAMAIIGMVIVEQIFRNTHKEQLWRVKHLLLGISAIFIYDFILYSDALLFNRIDGGMWDARGFVNALVIPLLAVSVARNPEWSGDVFVSRKAVFFTTSLLVAGVYLVVSALVGYYIRDYGGSWGRALQITFLFSSLVLLVLLLLSRQARAWLKVFLGRNFFQYQYDYRDEWLRLIQTMALDKTGLGLKVRAVKALADVVDSAGGMLWTRTESGRFRHNTSWNLPEQVTETVQPESPLIRFLEENREVIELDEYARKPEIYPRLDLPEWLQEVKYPWLIVPLILNDELIGFIVLVKPRAPHKLNWEEHDLLKTAGMQIASYVAFLETSEALMDARQFEAFNRISSYVVHDLKNVSAQLSLVVANAERHKNNPAFVEDAIKTIANATARMDRVLSQLRKRESDEGHESVVQVCDVLRQVISIRAASRPLPELRECDPGLRLLIDKERLVNILCHLVNNAQEAAGDEGEVVLCARAEKNDIVIEIKDNGCGMDERFIRERLFRPFDTTKGNAGMGIGVYESREFIWSQGGELTVQSRTGPDSATTFKVRLPRYDRAQAPEENNIAPATEYLHLQDAGSASGQGAAHRE